MYSFSHCSFALLYETQKSTDVNECGQQLYTVSFYAVQALGVSGFNQGEKNGTLSAYVAITGCSMDRNVFKKHVCKLTMPDKNVVICCIGDTILAKHKESSQALSTAIYA